MTVDKRRIDAALKACEGISTQNLEDNVPVLELARRYNVVLRERDALRAELSKQQALTGAAQHIAEAAQSRANQLQAKIAEMEQQEPYSYIYEYANPIDGSPVWRDTPGYWNAQFPRSSKPLYALPGAKGE